MLNIEKYRKTVKKEINNKFETMVTWNFNSIEELKKVASIPLEENIKYSPLCYKTTRNPDYSSHRSKLYSQNVLNSFGEALEMLEKGWEEGAIALKEKIEGLKSQETGRNMKSKYDVIGGNACVARYLQGIPTNMINTHFVERKDKVINVFKTMGYSAMYSSNEIMDEAAKSLRIVQILENSGYRCKLYALKYNVMHSDTFVFSMKIKDAKEPLNLKKCAFIMAHPDFQRRILYRLIELSDLYDLWRIGYGTPVDSRELQMLNEARVKLDDVQFSKYMKEKYMSVVPSEIKEKLKNGILVPIVLKGNIKEFIKKYNV